MGLINVDFGDGQVVPFEASKLEGPERTVVDNDNETTKVTVYRFMGRVVHRSVEMKLKKGIGIEGVIGRL